ncbi:N-acetyltransferase [Rudanella paleaurantiibacter]|uniref:N-acetyltransferase n=1 Tax=Rudanella paleaurantiibacter TaxID=2614655 RepID=A0A7J5U438_9BACT|nr:GNAT family N-acetyltransferase [Rudanella paleaurantiibacter]KAB7732608.1 N-acetyltransferase [Rudanella paleaurantiibacter]
MNEASTVVKQNTHRHRFELDTDGHLSVVEYQMVDDETMALTHTEVHPELEGKGIGSRLVLGTLEYAERNNLYIVPICPFVVAYIKHHPEWNRIVSKTYPASSFGAGEE